MSAVLDDFPVLMPVTDEDLALAARAVRVHTPESWPQGPLCRSERVPYPCRLARWGQATLEAAGFSEVQAGAMVDAAR
ncbi:hypothetical protein [Micromonospora eburnea]|uniref:Uncharacterized protein n=1 Tax=Micromonospora eburnea TaxID=227316 RepID=A0A1C6TV85_9ACTN|nr:hypothetical protein [Micromonospora eburnea]SCL45511.1 hypothetical protein GA0070604_1000 [Micromonospora eburnea]